MNIFCFLNPSKLYNYIHDLLRLAYPNATIYIDNTNQSDIIVTIKVISTDELIIIEGGIDSLDKKTNLRKEFNIKVSDQASNQIRKFTRLFTYELLSKHLNKELSSYGILTGIRPIKIIHRLLDKGYTKNEIRNEMNSEYRVKKEKTDLLLTVALNNREYLLSSDDTRRYISVYIGIPYCPSRCYYCSFPGAVLKNYETDIPPFLSSLVKEIQAISNVIKEKNIAVQNIYLGGGTPTILNEEDMVSLLKTIKDKLVSKATTEITVEAGRPDTISLNKLKILKEYGVERICINPQTMKADTLKIIGRNHDISQFKKVIEWAKKIGFKQINTDLIVGFEQENIDDNILTLHKVLEFEPENITVHTLATKKGSLLMEKEGKRNVLDKVDIIKKTIDKINSILIKNRYEPYYLYRQKFMYANMENVGYSLSGNYCNYNIQVMEERQTILGLGGGASSKFINPDDFTLVSIYNPKNPNAYIKSVEELIRRKVDKLMTVN
ncbi:Oxygen-independent coproporphyrinogen-III oxidase-like protein HemZ [Candidatus Syntrophocurvum alkaliphilum]|uniref:Oxygen-independent coproporphyrinogen-III oxidase-like protein HemZ n=1 Tax=Candidatus Syntrophocurvum alkaliphilum TaxID=2293317 RepID=A0A6I6DF50_9FIRM|nr:coproporphyrinogen dehydrogenase HemZ [Candidatus Syntrophocurvum alkaliphilum]QGT99118.1 Oxygen-independent coproporphyrinogen-III oxidase-like protein HemZ [Candidatus Syntrophocurvum alkaliphilum]